MANTDEVDKDAIFEVLSSSRRRQLLYYLHQHGNEATLRDLAREVAITETGEPVDNDVVKRLYISLYQTHIPKLEEEGLVVYNEEEKRVELTDQVWNIAHVLDVDVNQSRQWPLYYATLAVIGIVLAAIVHFEVAFAEILTTPIVAVAISGVLLLLTALHYHETNVKEDSYAFLETLVDGRIEGNG